MIVSHGLGEHCGRYQSLAEGFNGADFAVYALDHLGHGESPGPRAHIDRFTDYLPPLRELRQEAAENYADRPVFLLGHSMGGLIASRLLLEDQQQYRGAMLSGPALVAADPPPAPVMMVGRLLSALLPRVGLLAIDPSGVSRDPAVVAAYQEDPLVHHGKVSARLAVELLDTMAVVQDRASDITLPILAMHGGDDVLAAPAGSEAFLANVSSEDRALRILPGLAHEIFNEPEGADVLAQYIAWAVARID